MGLLSFDKGHYDLRAIAHRGIRNYEGYLSDSLRAHGLDPSNAESCNNAGEALLSLGREEEAIAWFDKALALLPDNPTILQQGRSDRPIAVPRRGRGDLFSRPDNCSGSRDGRVESGSPEAADWRLCCGLDRSPGAVENPHLLGKLSEISATDVARGRACRGKNHPRSCRRRIGRYDPVRALRTDGRLREGHASFSSPRTHCSRCFQDWPASTNACRYPPVDCRTSTCTVRFRTCH